MTLNSCRVCCKQRSHSSGHLPWAHPDNHGYFMVIDYVWTLLEHKGAQNAQGMSPMCVLWHHTCACVSWDVHFVIWHAYFSHLSTCIKVPFLWLFFIWTFVFRLWVHFTVVFVETWFCEDFPVRCTVGLASSLALTQKGCCRTLRSGSHLCSMGGAALGLCSVGKEEHWSCLRSGQVTIGALFLLSFLSSLVCHRDESSPQIHISLAPKDSWCSVAKRWIQSICGTPELWGRIGNYYRELTLYFTIGSIRIKKPMIRIM